MPILTPEERVGSTMAGKYRLERIVASGGMATVFAGVHAWTERSVAVKILNYEHARDPEVVRRFLQEARAAAQLKHPNVVDVLDMGEDTDGTVYLVLELLHGETLKARMRRGRLSTLEIGTLVLPVMRAVASAHAKSVVHRDLKPDNVFLAAEADGSVVPKLLDFGIAKVSRGDSSSTRTGMMVGTPQYMSPEQVRGDRDVGAAADVWSMGVVLHAAVCGRVPFEGESTAVVLARVITERARPLLSVEPGASPAIASVVDRALQYEPAARFADMGEMIRALEGALEGRALADVPSSSLLELAVTPTVQLDVRSIPPGPVERRPLSEPPVTPFAWATPADAASPPPPRSRASLLAIVAVAVVGLLALAALALGGAAATHTATPAMTSTPLPTPAQIAPVPEVPVASPPPVISAPATPEPPPIAAPVAVVPLVAVAPPVAEPRVRAPVSAPIEAPAAASSAAASSAAASSAAASSAAASSDAPTAEPRTRPTHEPRRGTRGALILH